MIKGYVRGGSNPSNLLAASHVDFLASGGYVLIPPSQAGGRPYQHVKTLSGHGSLDWHGAARLLEPSRDRPRPASRQAFPERINALARWMAAQREGNRNAGLFWAANRALEADHAVDLSPLADAARHAGLAEPEITRTLDSARRTSQAAPGPSDRQAERLRRGQPSWRLRRCGDDHAKDGRRYPSWWDTGGCSARRRSASWWSPPAHPLSTSLEYRPLSLVTRRERGSGPGPVFLTPCLGPVSAWRFPRGWAGPAPA
jgi:hypothetical protein